MDSYRITHLTFFENGAHHGGQDLNLHEHELFTKQLERIKAFCNDYGYSLITVESNLNSFLLGFFAGSNIRGFGSTHTFRNCGITLLFQRLFRVYYYSSAGIKEDIHFDITDSAHYDRLILPMVSTDNLLFYSSGKTLTRLEKLQLITNYKPSFDNLLVCYKESENCGVCLKCSFDIEYYYSHRNWYLTRFWMQKDYSPFMKENYDYAKQHAIRVPFSCKVTGTFFRYCRSFYIKYLQNSNNSFFKNILNSFINVQKKK